jgi:hypothetical protein
VILGEKCFTGCFESFSHGITPAQASC